MTREEQYRQHFISVQWTEEGWPRAEAEQAFETIDWNDVGGYEATVTGFFSALEHAQLLAIVANQIEEDEPDLSYEEVTASAAEVLEHLSDSAKCELLETCTRGLNYLKPLTH